MKKVLFIMIFIIFVLLIDSLIAFSFDRSSILRYRVYYSDADVKYIDKGILVDTYYCNNGNVDSIIKGFSYSCSDDEDNKDEQIKNNRKEVLKIVDESTDDMVFGQMLEDFYEDDKYVYSFPDTRSSVIVVYYVDGTKENVKDALKNGHIDISELDKFDIKYYKNEKRH